MEFAITSIYAAILGLMLVCLSINVIKGRRKFGAALGDDDNIEMIRRIRAQSNFTEYTPIFLIILGYTEAQGLPGWAVHLFAIIFLTGRLLHAYSVLQAEKYKDKKLMQNPTWRICGMAITFSAIITLAFIVFFQAI